MLKEYLTHKYQTSKDYNRLFDLMLNEVGRIICFVEQKGVQDVCQTSSEPIIKLEDGEKIYNFSVGARGISYINVVGNTVEEYRKDFISQCEDYNLEFIDMQEDILDCKNKIFKKISNLVKLKEDPKGDSVLLQRIIDMISESICQKNTKG